MKSKVQILHFPVALSAIIALIQLSGILSHAQFTKTKMLLCLLVIAGCACWIGLNKIREKISKKNISYGFGGVARVGTGTLPAECILGEHYRLGSERVILSRAFCDVAKETDFEVVKEKFNTGVRDIREFEKELLDTWDEETHKANHEKTQECVQKIVEIIKNK